MRGDLPADALNTREYVDHSLPFHHSPDALGLQEAPRPPWASTGRLYAATSTSLRTFAVPSGRCHGCSADDPVGAGAPGRPSLRICRDAAAAVGHELRARLYALNVLGRGQLFSDETRPRGAVVLSQFSPIVVS